MKDHVLFSMILNRKIFSSESTLLQFTIKAFPIKKHCPAELKDIIREV